jgi:hypothetical protein
MQRSARAESKDKEDVAQGKQLASMQVSADSMLVVSLCG